MLLVLECFQPGTQEIKDSNKILWLGCSYSHGRISCELPEKRGHYKIKVKMEEVANKRRGVFRSDTPSQRAQNKATTIRREQKVDTHKAYIAKDAVGYTST
jgi:hypothetical protein